MFSFRSSFVVRGRSPPMEEPRATSFVFFFAPPRTRLTPTPNPRNIHPRGVQFVEEGTFQKQADMTRLRAKYGAAEARAILSREAAETADANSVPLGEGAAGADDADDARRRALSKRFLLAFAAGAAEWWDAALLADGASYGADVLREKITLYVEHPVLWRRRRARRPSASAAASEADQGGAEEAAHAASRGARAGEAGDDPTGCWSPQTEGEDLQPDARPDGHR